MQITENDIGRKVIVDGVKDGVTFNNDIGYVCNVKYIGYGDVGVRFIDKISDNFHSCSEQCTDGEGFYVGIKQISFVVNDYNPKDNSYNSSASDECSVTPMKYVISPKGENPVLGERITEVSLGDKGDGAYIVLQQPSGYENGNTETICLDLEEIEKIYKLTHEMVSNYNKQFV